jgi:hypothetical protein
MRCAFPPYARWARPHLGGLWFWRTIVMESMHIQSQNVVGQARLIVGSDRVLRLNAAPVEPKIELWNWARCRRELPAVAQQLFEQSPQSILEQFLYSRADNYIPIYDPSKRPASPVSRSGPAGPGGRCR